MQLTHHEQLIHPLHLLMHRYALVSPFPGKKRKKKEQNSTSTCSFTAAISFDRWDFFVLEERKNSCTTECISFTCMCVCAQAKKEEAKSLNMRMSAWERQLHFNWHLLLDEITTKCSLVNSFLCANKYPPRKRKMKWNELFTWVRWCMAKEVFFFHFIFQSTWILVQEVRLALILLNSSLFRATNSSLKLRVVVAVVEKTKVSRFICSPVSHLARGENLASRSIVNIDAS